jgi:peroxiredoxin
MDCDGDGKIDARSKTENVYRRTAKDPVVFKTGGTYWEPLRVDDATGKFVMEQRTEADYAFLDLSVGAVMPDFSFVTLDGKTRKLSEYRGKYVLLDVWSTGCIPCREEMPILKTAYSTYGPRGFEILGLDTDENLDQLHRFLKEKGITWTQTSTATPGSGTKLETLINKQLRVTGIPTAILIGPDGKILSMGNPNEPRLRGSDFLETLEKLLPAPKTTTE